MDIRGVDHLIVTVNVFLEIYFTDGFPLYCSVETKLLSTGLQQLAESQQGNDNE